MKPILDDSFHEVDLKAVKFLGTLAGRSWQHEQALGHLQRARLSLYLMAAAVFYPVLVYFLMEPSAPIVIVLERLILAAVLVGCGRLFKWLRLVALLIPFLLVGLMILNYLFNGLSFSIWRFAFNTALWLLMGIGIYYHFVEQRLRRELLAAIERRDPEVRLPR
ncbi:MAG: hypothetical protein AAFW73_08170 [Bacteroidota bacterium]